MILVFSFKLSIRNEQIKTYENILKTTNQAPSDWYDDPNYGKFVYVSDFPHDESNYYGLSDLDVTFVIDSNKIKHKIFYILLLKKETWFITVKDII
jgi:hypothetical protein